MEALTLAGKTCDSVDLESIRSTVDTAPSLTGILAGVFAEPARRLTLLRMEEHSQNVLLGIVRCRSGSEVYFSLPEKAASKDRKLFDPREGVHSLADTGAPLIDDEWLDRRNRNLKIRTHRGLEAIEMEVSPHHAEDLLLSYALCQYGQVNVTREEWIDRAGSPHDALQLDLSCLDEERSIAFGELVWLDWRKLMRFIRPTGARMPIFAQQPR